MSATNPMKQYYNFFIALAVVSVLAIVSNVALRRAPVHDSDAANDIRTIQQNIDNYYLAHNQLPDSIATLRLTGAVAKRLGQYQYAVGSPTTYQICTNFLTEHHSTGAYPATGTYGNQTPDPTEHGKGQQCFAFQAVPAIDPTNPYRVK